VAEGRGQESQELHDLYVAQAINQAHGGAVVSMWDVRQMDQPTVDFFLGLTNDLPRYRRQERAVEDEFAKARRAHPTYRETGMLK
jgi:hypothetical protein